MNIVSTLKKYGIIQEMNDWKLHFTNGTKGQPKTDPELLDLVEDIIISVYENDEEKINNCKLAPWIVKNVKEIGFNNISDDIKNKFVKVLEWFKLSGNENIYKDMNLDDAFKYAESKGTIKKAPESEKKEEEEEKPYLQAEKEGRIRRIFRVNDGSKRIWVEVMDGNWLSEPGEFNPHNKWGVMCQTGSGFAGSENQNLQLIGPPSGQANGKWSTQIGMSGYRADKSLREIKQEGNHQPGSQKTSAGYSDADERIIDFLCFSDYAKKNVLKLCDYGGGLATDKNHGTGAAYFLYQIIKDKPNLLNKLADYREDLIETHKDLILKLRGQEWFNERKIDIEELAKTDPEKFLDRFETLLEKFADDAVKQLNKIDIDSIYNKNPNLILKNISSLIGRIPDTEFEKLFNKINLDEFMKSYTDSFKKVIKFLSNERNNKIYFGLFNYLMNEKTKELLSVFGNSNVGFANFIKFTESPRERIHQNAKYDGKKNEYIGIRKELVLGPDNRPLLDDRQQRITKDVPFVIKDDKKVLLQKERKKFIEKNKDLIKSFIKGDEFNKELNFLKFYIPQLSDQEVNKLLNTNVEQNKTFKDKIIDYYNNKYYKLGPEQQMPGILQFYKDFKFMNNQKNNIPLNELKKHQNELVGYFKEISKVQGGEEDKLIDAFAKFLELCKDNKASKEEIIKFIKNVEIDPRQNLQLANKFYTGVLKVLDRKLSIQELKNIKTLYDSLGDKGKTSFDLLSNNFALTKYKVNRGDRVMFKGNDARLPKLNLISGKKYLVIDTKNRYKIGDVDPETEQDLAYENIEEINYYVLVTEESEIENGGLNIWVPSFRFDVRTEKVYDFSLNENFKIFEGKFHKLRSILNEIDDRKPKYSAIVLDKKSKDKLLILIDKLKKEGKIGQDWAITADHVTINMGKIYDEELLNNIVNIKVIGIGIDENVAALRVTVNLDINFSTQKERTPHITLAYNKLGGAKPVMSNNLENWNNIETIELQGIVQEVF